MTNFGIKLATARDEWMLSSDGCKALAGTASGQYLRNRLELAFIAGWEARAEEPPSTPSLTVSAADARLAEQPQGAQSAVAWALIFPPDTRLNLSTVFDTKEEAADYSCKCWHDTRIVPLYLAPPALTVSEADVDAAVRKYDSANGLGALFAAGRIGMRAALESFAASKAVRP